MHDKTDCVVRYPDREQFMRPVDTTGMDLSNTEPTTFEKFVKHPATRAAEVAMLAAALLASGGCVSKNVEATGGKPVATSPAPEKKEPVKNVPDWQKPYNEKDRKAVDEMILGIIDQDALTPEEKVLINMPILTMNDEQKAAYLDTMQDIYHRWSYWKENGKYKTTKTHVVPFATLSEVTAETSTTDIEANLSLFNGMSEICYGEGNKPDVNQMARLIASATCRADNVGYAQKTIDYINENYKSDGPVEYISGMWSVSEYKFNQESGVAEFKARYIDTVSNTATDYIIEARTQKFKDAKDGEQKTMVLYNITKQTDLPN